MAFISSINYMGIAQSCWIDYDYIELGTTRGLLYVKHLIGL